jgi:hypothetical protein
VLPTTQTASAQPTPHETLFDAAGQPSDPQPAVNPSPLTSAAIIKQEANLLRFPFFALGRRGLRNHKGLLIRGQSKLESQTYDFEYRITCNTDDIYPGQLARKVHMGLLRLMQRKQAFPFANPIEFTWRELMDTIGILPGGRTVNQLKKAIRSIEGTRIRSKFALKNAHGQHLKGRERGYGLYSEYVFFDELMSDNETVANKNFVWLADWYLANINSLYCSPLDHVLWLRLDDASPIASRMYEFFTFNFAGDWQTLTIDYEKLVRFLPVSPKHHLSQIEQQFGPALALVVDAGILAQTTWQRGKRGQPQLAVRRGRLLTKRGAAVQWTAAVDELETTEIQELYRQPQPEDELVCQFHSLWDGDDKYRPTTADRSLARDIVTTYGSQQAETLLPHLVEIMREHFPKAKSFGATRRYWFDAAKDIQREQTVAERRKKEFIEQELEGAKARQGKADQQRWQVAWDRLAADDHQAIKDYVLATNSSSLCLEKHPTILHRFCLKELGKRQRASTAA